MLRRLPRSTLFPYTMLFRSQLANYRARIQALFDQHPDHDLFGSLPGAGAKLAPRLLAELARSEEHTSELQSHVNLVSRLLLEKKNRQLVRPCWPATTALCLT